MIDEVDREKITQYQMREGIMPEGFKFGVWTHHCTARLGRRIPEMFPKCILVSKAGIYLSTYATNGYPIAILVFSWASPSQNRPA